MIAAYSPEARGRPERAFGTHQGRLPNELAAAGITDRETANHYLREVYMPAFNAEFACLAQEDGTAFVPWIGGNLDDILCEQYERTVGNDNCVRFEGLSCRFRRIAIVATMSKQRYECIVMPMTTWLCSTGRASWPSIIGKERGVPGRWFRYSAAFTFNNTLMP